MYPIAEKFISLQGEGVYTGTPMAFIRFVGCSVGKTVCAFCDTDFDKAYPWAGGGEYHQEHLAAFVEASGVRHVCFTGGEPFDQPALPGLVQYLFDESGIDMIHFETSGTKYIPSTLSFSGQPKDTGLWLSVCPKPGYRKESIELADEIKVIVPGLGPGDGWPSLEDAVAWAKTGKPVFLQPRNKKHEIDYINLALCQDAVREHPELRLSVQMHKLLKVR